jgi:amino acid transporter
MRDNGLPFSGFFSQSVGEGSPFLVIAFLLFFDSLIMLLLLNDNSSTAFNSIIQLTAVGFQVSYAIPIICKVIWRPTNFPVTPFDLGNWSFPVGVISSLWLIGTSCIFFLPTVFPVSVDAMNWLIVVVSGCIALGTVNWIFNSRFNFTGPKRVAIAVPEDDMPRGLVIDNKA